MVTNLESNFTEFSCNLDCLLDYVNQNTLIKIPVGTDPIRNVICLDYFKLRQAFLLGKCLELANELCKVVRN